MLNLLTPIVTDSSSPVFHSRRTVDMLTSPSARWTAEQLFILASFSFVTRRECRRTLRDTYDATPKFDRRIDWAHTRRVKNERDEDWATELVKRVGKAMKDARNGRPATWLSDRTAELGYRIPATVISKLDSGHRGSVLGVAELVVLAAALDMPPAALLYPDLPDGEVKMLPNRPARSIAAARWFSGEVSRASIEGAVDPAQIDAERENMRRLRMSRQKDMLESDIARTQRLAGMSQQQADGGAEDALLEKIRAMVDMFYQPDLDRLAAEMSNRGWEVDNDA